MTNRDNRRWIKVFPRKFNNEYFFIGFADAQQKEKFMDKINDEVNSSAYTCRKSKVEQIEEFEVVTGYEGLDGVYTLYGSDIDVIQFID